MEVDAGTNSIYKVLEIIASKSHRAQSNGQDMQEGVSGVRLRVTLGEAFLVTEKRGEKR